MESVLTKNEYNKGDIIKIPLLKEKVTFEKIDSASIGDEVFIVIETENLQGKEIKINLKQANADGLEKLNDAMTVQQDGTDLRLIKATVGDFGCDSTTIENKDDFKDWAIAKIILAPKDDTKNKEYKASITDCENKTTNLYLAIDAESGDNNWFEVLYDEVFDATPNVWLKEEGKQFGLKSSIKQISIYHTGHIDKVDLSGTDQVKYVYHDANNKIHEICICDLIVTKEKSVGVPVDSFEDEENRVEIIDYTPFNSEGVDAKTTEVYSDGSVITDGKKYSQQHYKIKYSALNSEITLVHMQELNLDSPYIQFKFNETKREYANPNYLAAFIGALAELTFKVSCTGSCSKDGSAFPSLEHSNGYAIDTSYNGTLVNDQNIIDAMKKFGFGKRIRGSTSYLDNLTNHTKRDSGSLHDSHLHCGNLTPNYKKS